MWKVSLKLSKVYLSDILLQTNSFTLNLIRFIPCHFSLSSTSSSTLAYTFDNNV